jgi:hypothetical protein
MRAASMALVTTGTLVATFAHAAPEPPREHELRVGAAVTLAAGARGAASLSIVPAAGRRIDADAPLSLRLSATPARGLELPRHRYALVDAADPRAEAPRFDLALAGQTPGSYTLRVEARFWLCAARSCRAVRDTVEIPVTVEASTTPAPAPPTTTSR